MTKYLIAYDIADPRRLRKVHTHLKGTALPLQYSVFLLEGTAHDCRECIKALEKIINKKEDDLRFYTLPKTGLKRCLGKGFLPEGLFYSGGL